MQIESRILSLLEYYAEVQLIFCKYTTVFPISMLFAPFFEHNLRSTFREILLYYIICDQIYAVLKVSRATRRLADLCPSF